jgi:hypothetical protein
METLKAAEWVFANGGGDAFALLENGLVEHLADTQSDDWNTILAAQEEEILQSDRITSAIDRALSQFLRTGVSDERSNCGDESELENFRDTLENLKDRFGLDLNSEIYSINEELSERTQPDDEMDRGTAFSQSSSPASPREASDDDLRQIFGALRGGS